MNTINEIIKSIDLLKPISPAALQIIEIARCEDVELSEITDTISQDPAMAANILKLVNSAFFGLKTKIDTLKSAVTVLGTQQIAEMALIYGISGFYANKKFKGYSLGSGGLWESAVISSEIAKNIAHHLKHPDVERIFTAALIRDIGKVVLDQFVTEKVTQIHKMVSEQQFGYIEAEKAVLGIDHAELGAILLRKWSVPESIAKIIEHHHHQSITMVNDSETAIVQAADAICSMMGIGTGSDGMSYRLSQDVAANLIPEDQVEQLIGKILISKSNILSRFLGD